jgi:hypothetical protein
MKADAGERLEHSPRETALASVARSNRRPWSFVPGRETDRPALAGGAGIGFPPGAACGQRLARFEVPIEGCRSMQRPCGCGSRKLSDRIGDAEPGRRTSAVTIAREFVGALGAFQHCLVAVASEHEVGDAPNVDFRDHAGRLSGGSISTVNPRVPAFSAVRLNVARLHGTLVRPGATDRKSSAPTRP